MANNIWVLNASPLILLGKVGRVGLLGELAETTFVPRAVVDEIKVRQDGVDLLDVIRSDRRFAIRENVDVGDELQGWDLGKGETQVIAHCQACSTNRAVLDDIEARRCAKGLGIKIIGTLGVIGRAKEKNLVERAAPVIKELREKGMYVSEDIVEWMLKELGEYPST